VADDGQVPSPFGFPAQCQGQVGKLSTCGNWGGAGEGIMSVIGENGWHFLYG